jgi:hypothetical protein
MVLKNAWDLWHKFTNFRVVLNSLPHSTGINEAGIYFPLKHNNGKQIQFPKCSVWKLNMMENKHINCHVCCINPSAGSVNCCVHKVLYSRQTRLIVFMMKHGLRARAHAGKCSLFN